MYNQLTDISFHVRGFTGLNCGLVDFVVAKASESVAFGHRALINDLL